MSDVERAGAVEWDQEVDLLVVGAGPAGMTAALVAHTHGAEVLVLEKSEMVGGAASTSAGTLNVPGNRQAKTIGVHDSIEDVRRYWDQFFDDDKGKELREAYLESAATAIDFLEEHSEIEWKTAGPHPDYYEYDGSLMAGRGVVCLPFDGRLLGADFLRVRPPMPEFMIFGGMMVSKDDIPRLLNWLHSPSDFLYAGRLFARYLIDRLRFSRGTRLTMGNALVARLYYSLVRRGVPIRFGVRVDHLIQEQGRVLGAAVVQAGIVQRIRARRGVVLATGGIGRNAALRQRALPPEARYTLTFPPTEGDGMELAEAAGGHLETDHGFGAFWVPSSKTKRRGGETGLFPHLWLDRSKPGLIAVNRQGRRFVNEAGSYQEFVYRMFSSPDSEGSTPAYLVCDSEFVRKYGVGIVHPRSKRISKYVKEGYLKRGETLAELADKLGLPRDQFITTVTDYNAAAAVGKDPEFGRGEHRLDRFFGDPKHEPNPCVAPLLKAPFYAVEVWPAEAASSAGIAANADGQVLDADGAPIPGLYICGNDMASMMRGRYPGPGLNLGPAVTFAYRLAKHATASTDAAPVPRRAPASGKLQ